MPCSQEQPRQPGLRWPDPTTPVALLSPHRLPLGLTPRASAGLRRTRAILREPRNAGWGRPMPPLGHSSAHTLAGWGCVRGRGSTRRDVGDKHTHTSIPGKHLPVCSPVPLSLLRLSSFPAGSHTSKNLSPDLCLYHTSTTHHSVGCQCPYLRFAAQPGFAWGLLLLSRACLGVFWFVFIFFFLSCLSLCRTQTACVQL